MIKTVLCATFALWLVVGAVQSEALSMELHSADFRPDGPIPAQFTCEGKDTSPQLAWSGVPEKARSLALVMFDPDAPGGGFTHWVLYDIPATAAGIPRGGPPPQGARELDNSFGRKGYGGPCPKAGPPEHHYVFTLYALDTPSLGHVSDARDLNAALRDHTVASTRLSGTYRLRGR